MLSISCKWWQFVMLKWINYTVYIDIFNFILKVIQFQFHIKLAFMQMWHIFVGVCMYIVIYVLSNFISLLYPVTVIYKQ